MLALRYYGRQMATLWRFTLPAMLLPALGNTGIFYIAPLIVAHLVGRFTGHGSAGISAAMPYVLGFAGVLLSSEIVWRAGIHCLNRVDGRGIENLYVIGMDELLAKDAAFFHDNFAGSLTKRVLSFASRFEDFTDNLVFEAIVVAFTYYSNATRIMFEFNQIYRRVESSLTEAAQFTELLFTPPAVVDPIAPEPLGPKAGDVLFERVTFAHAGGRPLFTGLNLAVPAGAKLGLVGRSGGGKTTLTRLLLRLMDVDDGRILIGGQDITKLRQSDLWTSWSCSTAARSPRRARIRTCCVTTGSTPGCGSTSPAVSWTTPQRQRCSPRPQG